MFLRKPSKSYHKAPSFVNEMLILIGPNCFAGIVILDTAKAV